jgi:hypothetical protein
MTIDRNILARTSARYSWVISVVAALGLLLLWSGSAWPLGEDAVGCPALNAIPPAHQTLAGEEQFPMCRVGALLVSCQFTLTFTSECVGGQTSSASQKSSTDSPAPPPDQDQKQLLKVNPVTGVIGTSASGYTPLTGSERLEVYFKMNYGSIGSYFGPVMSALLLDQATGSPYRWGGGFRGYGRRVSSRVGNAMLQGTIQAPVAAVLHEDVRYIASSQHSFQRRAVHAAIYSFFTYNGEGHPTPNVANLAAYYASTAVSTAWLPGIRNLAKYTLSNSTEQLALSVPINLLQEFWPEVRRHVLRKP